MIHVMKKSIFFVLTIFSMAISYGQVTVGVGSAAGTNNNLPITGYYGYSYSQMIYPVSEIIAGGGEVGNVTKVRFYYNSGPNGNSNNWTIYMGHTNKNEFTSTTDWESFSNLTQVYTGTVTFPAAGNWMEITLSVPFLWNGIDNLIIAVDENSAGYSASDLYWRSTSTVGYKSIYYRNDSNNPDPLSPPTATGRHAAYADVELEMLITPCSGTPVHDVVDATLTSVCVGTPVTYNTDANNTIADLNYQWQYNIGLGWTDFASSVNAWQFTTSELTQSGDVRAIVTCTNSSLTDTMDFVSVVVNPLPTIIVNPNSYAVCNGGSVVFNATGANTYSWAPATYLDNTSTATVTSTPTTNMDYIVTGTDINNCVNTSTASVTMMSTLTSDIISVPAQICSPGSLVDLIISGLPAALSGGGSYEYQFLDEDSVTVLQPWSTSSVYSFIPPTDGEYAFVYKIRNSACPGDMPDSVRVAFSVGFGADVDVIDFNCQHDGSFILSNIFGQSAASEVYSNLLDSPGSVTDITFSGVASITGGRAVLTPSATGSNGYMLIDLDTVDLLYNNTLNVSFLMTADQPINNFGTGGADGIAYSFGNDALPASPGPAHNGKGTKLRLSFDAANNSMDNGNATGIYLVYGWSSAVAYGPGSTGVLAYSPNTSLWKLKTDVPVNLNINALGKITVTVDGVIVFDEVQLPVSYLTEDVTHWNHLFSASTGGDALRQAVADLSITTEGIMYGIHPGPTATLPSAWQYETGFDSLAPGEYTLWIANPSDTSCNRNLGVFEIEDINPVVTLPDDTIICNGDSLILDAGNIGSTYLWSTFENTQTITAFNDDIYSVMVTDTANCTATGAINISVGQSPSADGIYASGSFPTVFFSVISPINTTQYNWNFGDGNTQINVPSSVGHTYATMGTYNVTATISNDAACDSVVLNKTIVVDNNELSINENSLYNIKVYPNPTSDFVNIKLADYVNAYITVHTLTGSLVLSLPLTSSLINVSEWADGVYVFKVTQGEHISFVKITVNH